MDGWAETRKKQGWKSVTRGTRKELCGWICENEAHIVWIFGFHIGTYQKTSTADKSINLLGPK